MRWFFLLAVSQALFTQEKFVIGTAPKEGFFSSFLGVLSSIIWTDRHHRIPVVHWSEEFLYAQKEPYNGSVDPWEYYFEPVSPLSYEIGDQEHPFCSAPDDLSLAMSFLQKRDVFNRELRFVAKETIDKYIRVKPQILEKVDLFYETKMAGKKTVGIHLRGTDRAICLQKEKLSRSLLEAAEEAAKGFAGDVQFFVATDEESLLDLAKQVLKRPLLYCDSHRSQDDSPIHFPKPGVEKGGAVLGEEVLIEALLLSKCDFFVHSLSSLPIAVLTFNPDLPYEYVDPSRWLDIFNRPPLPRVR